MEKELDNIASSDENTLNESKENLNALNDSDVVEKQNVDDNNEYNLESKNSDASNNEGVDEVQNSDDNNAFDLQSDKKERPKALKIIGKILNWFSIGIIAILLVIVGWLTIDKFILKSKAPSIFGYSYFIVETGSMNGLDMNEGDLIFVHPADRYITGDIITFFQNENLKIPTTHRIVGIEGEGFITKGDANNTNDTVIVTHDMIVGKVVKVIPHVGTFFSWVKEGGGLIYIITFVCIVGIGIYIIKKE